MVLSFFSFGDVVLKYGELAALAMTPVVNYEATLQRNTT
jgi:tRNA G37 N-methylase TrmD